MEVSVSDSEHQDIGKLEYGCEHYKRRCKIRAPCCNKVFTCRHCHNAAMSMLDNPKEQHEIVRTEVNQVICSVCDTEQQVTQKCINCGVKMGEYFCGVCKFYDDDISKGQFHCNGCGICRVGGQENFFHCQKCGSCYSTSLIDNHFCLENSMQNNCPVCYEYLFDSLKKTSVMKCGHTMHMDCLGEMTKHNKYCCPMCFKSVRDMSSVWQRMDEEIEATVMPEEYRDKKIWILCNDCNTQSEVRFHIIGLKCTQCNSYNTRKVASPESPQ